VAGAAVLALIVFIAIRSAGRAPQIGPTAIVKRGQIERIVVASGTIEPEHLVEVRPKISGIVEKFMVDTGDHVKAGQVVAEIDREELEAAVREARAQLQGAKVNRIESKRALGRRAQLLKSGSVSKDELDKVSTQNDVAEANLESAQATVDRLEQQLAYATIAAPIDGVVLARDLNPGAAVASVASVTGGTVLMTIADTTQMHLLGVVDENEFARVKVGMTARIRTEAYPDRVFPGTVRKVASLGDRKENVTSFKVEVNVDEGIDKLWPRMSADADIVAEVHDHALTLPEAALLYEGDDIFVQVAGHSSGPSLKKRRVKVGITTSNRVEILSGVADKEVVKLQ
jgi:HlyD family secretion protein